MKVLKNAVLSSGAISLQEYDSYLYPIECKSVDHAQDFYFVDKDKRKSHNLKIRCINNFIFIFNLDGDILFKFTTSEEYLSFIHAGKHNFYLRQQ